MAYKIQSLILTENKNRGLRQKVKKELFCYNQLTKIVKSLKTKEPGLGNYEGINNLICVTVLVVIIERGDDRVSTLGTGMAPTRLNSPRQPQLVRSRRSQRINWTLIRKCFSSNPDHRCQRMVIIEDFLFSN